MPSDDLCFLGAAVLTRLYAAGDLSPVEVTRAVLQRLDALQPQLNAFVTRTPELAMESAQRAERAYRGGEPRGVLAGVPVSLKDLFHTRGIRTTAGSRQLRALVPQEDATVTARLHAQGAVLIGKCNMLELAYGEVHDDYGPTRNPYGADYSAGGSSSGSAASVAAGIGCISYGSDTGGSIRLPAAYCGVVGLKPTYGLISRHGVVPLSWSLDHVGPLTRTVADAALALDAVAGYDPKDPTSARTTSRSYLQALTETPEGLTVGILRSEIELSRPVVRSAVEAALTVIEGLGVRLREIELPSIAKVAPALFGILLPEASAALEPYLQETPQDFSAPVRERLEMGLRVTAVDYLRSQRFRAKLTEELNRLYADVDLIVLPTATDIATPTGAPRSQHAQDEDPMGPLIRRTGLSNLTGHPALSIPCGFSPEGLPVGLQILAPALHERRLLKLAAAYESAAGFSSRRPNLPFPDLKE